MDAAHTWLLLTGILLIASILAGKLSSRIGAPLLLIFLILGMIAGEEGLGGVVFGIGSSGGIPMEDARTAYLIGSAALTFILFDGGIRTERRSFGLALWPALALATVGVVVTAAITGLVAAPLLGRGWLDGFLVGAIVASTDAAAVFVLLHQRGSRTSDRLNATLEIESGINDPVAVFLTVAIVALLQTALRPPSGWELLGELAREAGLGAIAGLAGGALLAWTVNRLDLAQGLYPILALAGGLAIFAGTQLAGGSGYLAAYLAGIVLGNVPLHGSRLVARFVDGMAWLAQIVLFLMLGLFVSPRLLAADAVPALAIALALMFIARPAAVFLCLTPFRFTLEERLFVSWVGLRGAVPIFLAMFPLLAGLPGAAGLFNIAFIVVLASLALQGWTIAPALRWLGLELPPAAEEEERLGFDLPAGYGREVSVYRVAAGAPVLGHSFAELRLPKRSRILAVLRDGTVQHREALDRLEPRDLVFAVVPLVQHERFARLFLPRPQEKRGQSDPLGDFVFAAETPIGTLANLYGLPILEADPELSLAEFVRRRLKRIPTVGDRIHLGEIDLVVRAMDGEDIAEIGLVLEPHPLSEIPMMRAVRNALRKLRWR